MDKSLKSFPTTAQIVIIGGGIAGCSVAYHLVKLGCKDVVVLERAQITSGTTWHAAGLLTTLRDTETQTHLAAYSQKLYKGLEAETGQATGFIPCGSIQIAMTRDKVEEMRRGIRRAQTWGIECNEIGASDVKRHWPLAYVDDIQAAFHFPNDGRINPTDVTRALMIGARSGGVRFFENTPVSAIETKDGRVTAVVTARGTISTEIVVNCAGMWARQVGLLCGVDIPLQAAEHYYMVSEPVSGAHTMLPILRDPGRQTYIREDAGKILVGIFEDIAHPWHPRGTVPEDFTFGEIPPNWERLTPYLERAIERVPILANTGVKLLFCGPESFTADHNYLMGEAPNLKGFFVAAGFNSLGILSGGGVGSVMAHWIVHGHAPMDVWSVNLRRTFRWQNNPRYLSDRVVESLGIGFQDHWPFRQWTSARGVKKSVLHDRLVAARACFGESAGWERANWYAHSGQPPEYRYGWGRQNWLDDSAAEHRSVREAVGLFDQSSFAKLLVQGKDAERCLNRIATTECRIPIGKLVYTQFLNERGGIEADVTVMRLKADTFMIITPAFTATHVEAWIRDHVSSDAHCWINDASDAWCMLNIQGPRARELLQSISDADWSGDHFGFATVREVTIGYQQVLAARLSFTGELGWELYIPVPFATAVYDTLIGAGTPYGLRHCGYHALNSLRIEKAYRDWGHEIGPDDTPLEAGLDFTCAWKKPDGFIGIDVLQKLRGEPRKRRLVQFLLTKPEFMLYHHEPILRNGKQVGEISSGMFGHTLGAAVGLGYVEDDNGVSEDWLRQGEFEILIGDSLVPARASLRPMYDPDNSRIRR